jgi:hypothetical protein
MIGSGYLLVRLVLALAAASLPVAATGHCLPSGMPFELAPSGPALSVTPPSKQSMVFADASGSMRGFVRAGRSEFATVYQRLPAIVKSLGQPDVGYFRVGKGVESITEQEFDLARSPTGIFYCPPARGSDSGLPGPERKYRAKRCLDSLGRANDFNSESRIETAVLQIRDAARAGTLDLGVIVTDLFVSDNEVGARYGDTFRDSVGEILSSGEAVDIVGIEAPFQGTIFDLPDFGPNAGPRHDGTHPFFILAFGSTDRVRSLARALTSGSDEPIRRSWSLLFTPLDTTFSGTTRAVPLEKIKAPEPPDQHILGRDMELDKDIRALPPAQSFRSYTLPSPNSHRWRSISAAIALPIVPDSREFPGRLQIADLETFAFSEVATEPCRGLWRKPWNDATDPLVTLDRRGYQLILFNDPVLAKQFWRAMEFPKPVGSVYLERVALRWVPESENVPELAQVFGFRQEEERKVLANLSDVPPRSHSGRRLITVSTKGFFPTLNLPELLARLANIHRHMLHPVDLGYFVIAWRYER